MIHERIQTTHELWMVAHRNEPPRRLQRIFARDIVVVAREFTHEKQMSRVFSDLVCFGGVVLL
jgi:hypothetical protein